MLSDSLLFAYIGKTDNCFVLLGSIPGCISSEFVERGVLMFSPSVSFSITAMLIERSAGDAYLTPAKCDFPVASYTVSRVDVRDFANESENMHESMASTTYEHPSVLQLARES